MMLAVAAFWLGTGAWRLVRPGEDKRRAMRRLQAVMLVAGSALLAGTAIALFKRQ